MYLFNSFPQKVYKYVWIYICIYITSSFLKKSIAVGSCWQADSYLGWFTFLGQEFLSQWRVYSSPLDFATLSLLLWPWLISASLNFPHSPHLRLMHQTQLNLIPWATCYVLALFLQLESKLFDVRGCTLCPSRGCNFWAPTPVSHFPEPPPQLRLQRGSRSDIVCPTDWSDKAEVRQSHPGPIPKALMCLFLFCLLQPSRHRHCVCFTDKKNGDWERLVICPRSQVWKQQVCDLDLVLSDSKSVLFHCSIPISSLSSAYTLNVLSIEFQQPDLPTKTLSISTTALLWAGCHR